MTGIDRSMLKQITQASLEVYDLAHRVQDLSEETKQVLGQAEELLHKSGLAYLMGEAAGAPASEHAGDPAGGDPAGGYPAGGYPAERMVDAYIQAQQGLSDLKDALYRLAQAALAQVKPAEAQEMLSALEAISPGYRDVQDMLRRTGAGSFAACLDAGEFDKANDQLMSLLKNYPGVFDEQEMRQRLVLAQARKLFNDGDHEAGRELLRKHWEKHPKELDVRLAYLMDYIDEILMQLPYHPNNISFDPLPNLERLQKVELPFVDLEKTNHVVANWNAAKSNSLYWSTQNA